MYGGQQGVMHLAAEQIFAMIEQRPDFDFLLRCSYIEVYNEALRDLLGSSDKSGKAIQLREDPHKGVYVDGASEEIVTDAAGIVALLAKGESARSVGSTAMNERSSRSHTVFRIVVESKAAAGAEADGVLVGALSLVDLAGSESVRHTGATGQRAKEGGKINQSLLTLSRVIKQLGDRACDSSEAQHHQQEPFVNFRDSKLTRLLQPTLGGDARLAMVCCVAPSENYVEETRSTLQFAQRAAKVRLAPQVHEVLDDASQLRRVKRQLAELQRRQQEYEALGRSGKTEELSRLLDANTQLSEAVASKEAELSNQVEMIGRLKRMIVLGGDCGRADDEAAVGRLGEKGFITTRGHRRHRKARETWAPGVVPQGLLFSATAKLPNRDPVVASGGDVAELLVIEARPNNEQQDLLIFEEEDEPAITRALASPAPTRPVRTSPTSAERPSPGALSAQFSEHRKRATAQIGELRAQLDEALMRAERAERQVDVAIVEMRAECAAADDDAEKRQLASLDRPADDASVGELCDAIRARRERWRGALDAATDERASAEREAYVLKQEVVELREISESFDAHVAEIDSELGEARREAGELQADLDAARQELASREASLADALDQARAADASRDAALDRLAEAERDCADRHDAALRRRAAAVEAVERDADALKVQLADAEATSSTLRDELDAARRQQAELLRRIELKTTECDQLRDDLADKKARIARLEQVKMTTDIFKKIQQMQLEKARFEGENRELRAQLAQLEAEIAADDRAKPLADEAADSPFRQAAAALSRGGLSSSIAAKLQLDELANRNTILADQLKRLSKLALDLLATALRELGYSDIPEGFVSQDADGILLVDNADSLLDSLAGMVRGRLANVTQNAAPDPTSNIQAKLNFLEQENLDLMLEIKQIREAQATEKLQPRLNNRVKNTPSKTVYVDKTKTGTPQIDGKENVAHSPFDADKPECTQS